MSHLDLMLQRNKEHAAPMPSLPESLQTVKAAIIGCADSRHVAQLSCRAREQRLGEERIVLTNSSIIRQITVTYKRATSPPPEGQVEPVDVDKGDWFLYLVPHDASGPSQRRDECCSSRRGETRRA